MGETPLIDLSRLMALRRKLDVAANIETTGFRAQHLSFQEYLALPKDQKVGAKRERPLSLVDAGFAFTSTSGGSIQMTGNPFDVAIDGNAYFVIQTDQGERYTRDGSFSLDGAGRLVTLDGRLEQTRSSGPIATCELFCKGLAACCECEPIPLGPTSERYNDRQLAPWRH